MGAPYHLHFRQVEPCAGRCARQNQIETPPPCKTTWEVHYGDHHRDQCHDLVPCCCSRRIGNGDRQNEHVVQTQKKNARKKMDQKEMDCHANTRKKRLSQRHIKPTHGGGNICTSCTMLHRKVVFMPLTYLCPHCGLYWCCITIESQWRANRNVGLVRHCNECVHALAVLAIAMSACTLLPCWPLQ
jgi:hypothetical protein